MNRTWSVTLFLLLVLLASSRGDDLVRFPAGDAAWTVDVTYSVTPVAVPGLAIAVVAAKRPKKIEVTQSATLRSLVVTQVDGKRLEQWSMPAMGIELRYDAKTDSVTVDTSASRYSRLHEAQWFYNAAAFTWINAKNQIESEPVNYLGKKCYHYQASIPDRDARDPQSAPPLKRMAWIDSSTLLPVALGTDTSLSAFTFQSPPPAGPLVLPAKFQAELDFYKKSMGLP